ncbi:MAG: Uncharacterised protein [Chloroflexota bacterium]|nr:MAG: Uncharacterised protein [Chloroflexota bacterium]
MVNPPHVESGWVGKKDIAPPSSFPSASRAPETVRLTPGLKNNSAPASNSNVSSSDTVKSSVMITTVSADTLISP